MCSTTYHIKCIICGIEVETKSILRILCYNKECDNKRRKQAKVKWNKNNPDKVKIIRKRNRATYYKKHKAKITKRNIAWQKNNPDKIKQYQDKCNEKRSSKSFSDFFDSI